MTPGEQDLRRIAAESMCDMRTVRRAYAGGTVRNASAVRIVAAARKLGVSAPTATVKS